MIEVPLTFLPVLHPPRSLVHPHPCGIAPLKKIQPPILNNPPALVWVLALIRAPLPSWISQTVGTLLYSCIRCSSLLRIKIFLRLWALVMFCPTIIRSIMHNLQAFWPAILMRFMVFEHHKMSTVMLLRHHFATSALVSNQKFYVN
jgi:hypothetical protein